MTPKNIVTTIAGTIVLISGYIITEYMMAYGFDRIIPQLARFGLTCLLAYYLVKGSNAVRRLCMLLFGLGGVSGFVRGIELIGNSSGAFILIGLGTVYIVIVVVLLNKNVAAYFKPKETKQED